VEFLHLLKNHGQLLENNPNSATVIYFQIKIISQLMKFALLQLKYLKKRVLYTDIYSLFSYAIELYI
jgi:hypothetical protein